jgi:hypothetical protein
MGHKPGGNTGNYYLAHVISGLYFVGPGYMTTAAGYHLNSCREAGIKNTIRPRTP